MSWIALIMALLPLIEMLLKWFKERRPSGPMRKRLEAALKRANDAADKLTPAERGRHSKLLNRLSRCNREYERL